MKQNIEDIYQSNTNLNPRDMMDYLQMAINYGYIVRIVFPVSHLLHYTTALSLEGEIDQVKAVRSGSEEGQKIIPSDAMDRMIRLFQNNITRLQMIQRELDLNDNRPQLWFDQINKIFPPPVYKRR